jgi:hypothetical protein
MKKAPTGGAKFTLEVNMVPLAGILGITLAL